MLSLDHRPMSSARVRAGAELTRAARAAAWRWRRDALVTAVVLSSVCAWIALRARSVEQVRTAHPAGARRALPAGQRAQAGGVSTRPQGVLSAVFEAAGGATADAERSLEGPSKSLSGPQIEGYVLDATGGAIAGAALIAEDRANASSQSTAFSGADGHFTLGVMGGTSVQLTATAEGYSRAVVQVEAPRANVRLFLVPGGLLAGRVVDEATGQPISGASVTAVNVSGAGEPGALGVTALDGSFRLGSLATGEYTVRASAAGFADAESHAALAVSEGRDDLLLKLPRGSALQAMVSVGDSGCAGASVLLEGPSTASALAGPDGAVELTGLSAGEYAVTVHCDGALLHRDHLTAIAGLTATRRWQLDAGASIRGSVRRASGQPLPGAHLIAQPVLPPSAGDEPRAEDGTASVCESNAAGDFECSGLLPGEYEVGLIDVGQRRALRRIALGSASIEGIVIQAAPGATLRVGVRERHGSASLPALRATQLESGRSFSPEAEGDGYIFRDIDLGRYDVHFPAGQGVDVRLDRDGQVVQVEIVAPTSAGLSGVVVDEHSEPVPDVWVRAHPALEPAGVLGTSASVLTDDHGRFTLEAFAAGELALSASGAYGTGELTPVSPGATDLVVRLVGSTAP